MDFKNFEEKIKINFNDKSLLKAAFTHRSYLNENPGDGFEHNERLEFLGDAVLELITTEFLYKKYPKKAEGEMTALRAALVNTISLSDMAGRVGLEDSLLLSKGEARDKGKARQYILANTAEALIGAIYLDQGYDVSKIFLEKYLFPEIEEIIATKSWIDAKSLFQEKAQEVEGVTPTYNLLKESGPDHDKCFVVGVFVGDEKIAEGEGKSKQEAEQDAAKAGLEKKGWE